MNHSETRNVYLKTYDSYIIHLERNQGPNESLVVEFTLKLTNLLVKSLIFTKSQQLTHRHHDIFEVERTPITFVSFRSSLTLKSDFLFLKADFEILASLRSAVKL